MTASAPTRWLPGVVGLACAAAVAAWWLGSTRIALERAADPLRASNDALLGAWLLRAMVLGLLAPRAGVACEGRSAVAAALLLVAPAWPVVVLIGAAGTTPWGTLAAGEIALLLAAVVLPALGAGLRRALGRIDVAEPLATALGVALATLVWFAVRPWATN
jgi:hypothetical protein